MKKAFLTLCLAAFGLMASAETFNYLTIVQKEAEQSFALTKVRRLTFDGSNLVVTPVTGTPESFALSNLKSITFTSNATAIQSAKALSQSLSLHAGQLVATGAGSLRIYNAKGQLLRVQPVSGGRTEVNLTGLPQGLYIARLGQQTLKMIH